MLAIYVKQFCCLWSVNLNAIIRIFPTILREIPKRKHAIDGTKEPMLFGVTKQNHILPHGPILFDIGRVKEVRLYNEE